MDKTALKKQDIRDRFDQALAGKEYGDDRKYRLLKTKFALPYAGTPKYETIIKEITKYLNY